MDALLLARIQFGFTVSFHIVFPGLTIGLASYLAVLEGLWLRTERQVRASELRTLMQAALLWRPLWRPVDVGNRKR